MIGGAAAPRSMIEAFEQDYGIEVLHGWGMTEMSPVGSVCSLDPALAALPAEERRRLKQKQGHAIWGVEFKIVDEQGRRAAPRRPAAGVLYVRGPWIASAYFRGRGRRAPRRFDAEGWFSTGDVATIDPARLHADHRPRQGHDPLGRRVDQLDRARERRGRPSRASPRPRRSRPPIRSGASARC